MAKRNGADPRQRQLGSIEAEVVNGLLPAGRPSAMPTSVADFDGWDADDVFEWLDDLAGSFRQLRAVVGLGLWVLRDKTDGEEAYTKVAKELAARFGVNEGTLRRWRIAVQKELGLPDPKGAEKRAQAAAAAAAKRAQETASAREMRANQESNEKSGTPEIGVGDGPSEPSTNGNAPAKVEEQVVARDDTRQAEVQPPAAQANGPGATGTTVSPRAPGSSSARGAESPAPPTTTEPLAVTVEWLAGQLAARKPTEARAMSVATFAKLESWVQQARAVRPQPATAPIAPRREDTSAGSAKCLHPVTRRIGDRCGACGATTKAGR